MTYRFAGFFAENIEKGEISITGEEYTVREITIPFNGLGIRIEKYIGENPNIDEIRNLAIKIGFNNDTKWIFLIYDCWAGKIDYLWGFVHTSKSDLGPISSINVKNIEGIYLQLMAHFGVSKENSLNFLPFHRGFWAE